VGNIFNLLFLQKFSDAGSFSCLCPERVKCYKQTCIALAIKKVRLFRSAKNAAARISTEMARTRKVFKGTSVGLAALDLYGQATCREEEHLAIL